nr:cytochrome P450 3045C5-3 [Brachionus rubens]
MYFEYENFVNFLTGHIYSEKFVTFLKVTSTSLIGLGAIYIIKIFNSYRYFRPMGIKTVDHKFFFGNSKELNKNYLEKLKSWTRKYGKTYGYFEGHLPVLVTSDLNILKVVFNQHHFFANRPNSFEWTRMKNIMDPINSTENLKVLGPSMIKCADRMLEVLENELEIEIDIMEYLKRFTLDSIWNCALDIDLNVQFDHNLFNRFEKMLNQRHFGVSISTYFHEFANLINKFKSSEPISKIISDVVDKRKIDGTRKNDYLQLILDAPNNQDSQITFLEIKQNLAIFIHTGYKSISNILGYCVYTLACYQEEQQKLYDEIKTIFYSEDDIRIDFETLNEIEYLDMFIKEVLRFYPIKRVSRVCTKTFNRNGIHIPEGTIIEADVLSIHFDKDLWGPIDPNEFNTQRFKDKRNPLGFLSFGTDCIGMKFELIQLKIAVCKLVLKYEFLPLSERNKQLDIVEDLVREPKNGIKITLRKRLDHFNLFEFY